jgi:hypothetical protein
MEGFAGYPVANPADEGFRAGLSRAAAAGIEVDVEKEEAPALLLELLEREEGEIHTRFALLFAEQFGIATAARRHYGEDPISSEEARSYFETARTFLNSFTHP